MAYFVYILHCADGTYYTGSTSDVMRRIYEHQNGISPIAYTCRRRPIKLVWADEVSTLDEALGFERQIKGWSRKKKEALIRGNIESIHDIVSRERKEKESKFKCG